jgi:hypothetical protein
MANSEISDDLWEEFHRVVNMTSRELGDWLRAESAGAESESLPDQAGPAIGRQVLAILGKRRADLTPADLEAMEAVVATVRQERGEEPEPTAGDEEWRRRLMNLGHDPLKPAGAQA